MDIEANGSPDSEVIHRLEAQHRHYSEQLEILVHRPYLSEQEQLEEIRLKKLKLYVKDQLVARRSSYHQAYVA
ncbi:MAG TPA: hypothetical protein VHT28_04565 [Silvibacterium sp.]|jgi:hypothetical protein|nr:hypothetical protein [Silvibacterium sp.]